ncbi:hypothetical protein N8755_04715 [Alphaproteobacteria bacterium]|nr:hypothetical protein [Alphaproteobacteria bacterium]
MTTNHPYFSIVNPITRLIGLFVTNKILASELGVAEYGAFMNLQANLLMLGGIPLMGLAPLILKYTRQYDNKIIATKNITTTITFVLLTLTVLLAISNITSGKNSIFSGLNPALLVAITLSPLANQVYFAVKRHDCVLYANLLSLSLITLMFSFDAINLANSYLIILALNAHFVILFIIRGEFLKLKIHFKFGKTSILWPYLLTGLISFISIPLTQYILRQQISGTEDAIMLAHWMAVVKLNELYILIPLYYLSSIGYKKYIFISQTDHKHELLIIIAMSLIYTTIASITFLVVGDQIIQVLFSSEFTGVKHLFIISLIGNFSKVILMSIGFYFLAKNAMFKFNVFELLPPIFFVIFFQMNYASPLNAVLTYSATYAMSLVIGLGYVWSTRHDNS